MSITISARYLRGNMDVANRGASIYGRLELDATGARLVDVEDQSVSVPLTDPDAVTAIRTTVAGPGEPGAYTGEVCLYGWWRELAGGIELYRVDSIELDVEFDQPRDSGPLVVVREGDEA